MYKFAAASETETTVFGASRPGYKNSQVMRWINFMQKQHINRVCCLLAPSQLARYDNLLDTYQQKFGQNNICWTPIKDFHLVEGYILINVILPFLIDTQKNQERVVVHCSGGVGRTGQVLTAWLVAQRAFSNKNAIATVKKTGRNPYEALIIGIFTGQNPWKAAQNFHALLNDCRCIN